MRKKDEDVADVLTYNHLSFLRCHSGCNCRRVLAVIVAAVHCGGSRRCPPPGRGVVVTTRRTRTTRTTRVEKFFEETKRRATSAAPFKWRRVSSAVCNGDDNGRQFSRKGSSQRRRTWHVCHRETGALDEGKGLSKLFLLVLSRHPAVNSEEEPARSLPTDRAMSSVATRENDRDTHESAFREESRSEEAAL